MVQLESRAIEQNAAQFRHDFFEQQCEHWHDEYLIMCKNYTKMKKERDYWHDKCNRTAKV